MIQRLTTWVEDFQLWRERFSSSESGGLAFRLSHILYSTKSRVRLYSKLAALIKNGVSIQSALESLYSRASRKSKNDVAAVVIGNIVEKYNQGSSFAEALSDLAPVNETILIRAGEESGRIDKSLLMACRMIKARGDIISSFLSAMLQPIVYFFLIAIALLVIARQVMPSLIATMNPETWTGSAYMLYKVSNFVNSPWSIVMLGLILVFFVSIISTMGLFTGPVRRFLDSIPPWSFYRLVLGAGWLLSLAALVRAGVTIADALGQMSEMAGNNKWLKQRLDETLMFINRGRSLGDALDATGNNFPDRDIVEDLIVYSDMSSVEDSLYKLGDDWINEGIVKIQAQASILNYVALFGMFGVFGLLASGVISIQGQISTHMFSMGM